MAIDLGNKISSSDVEKMKDKRNPPEFEDGFDDESLSDFGSLFDDIEFEGDSFGDGDSFGSSSSSFGGSSGDSFGSFGSFGGSGLGTGSLGTGSFGSFGSGLGNNQGTTQKPQEKTLYDKAFDESAVAIESLGKILVDMFKSVKLRTADDWGYFSNKTLKVSLVMIAISLLLGIIGLVGKIRVLSPLNFPMQLGVSGALVLGAGLTGIGLSALYIEKYGPGKSNTLNAVQDIPQSMQETEMDEALENDFDSLFEFEDDDDEEDDYESDGFGDFFSESGSSFDDFMGDVEDEKEANEQIEYDNALDNIQSNVPIIDREYLYNNLKKFFPTHTPGFANISEIDPQSDTFTTLEALAIKALASAGRMEYEDAVLKTHLESASENFFAYTLRLKRIKGLSKLDEIEKEIVAYFRNSSDDDSVTCRADLEGDFYKLVINKGTSAIITFGDLFTIDEVDKFIRDPNVAIPIVAGISDIGQPIIDDGKYFDSILVAGKPRSGKSWYILQLLWMMIVFNTPTDVQLLIIDPKESNLFKTLGLMPHVCGVHSDTNILKILDDLINIEGARRKQILADNRCENVWDLRKKGVKLPIIYIVIDEVVTALGNLGADSKELLKLIKMVVTQLPSQGIRLIMIPHRAKGVIEPTIRTNISMTVAIKAEPEIVKETLDIPNWRIPLVHPGDAALKMSNKPTARFIHGPAVTSSDIENTEHIITVAKAFYKMGVEMPDMSTIGCGYNQDLDAIKVELGLLEERNNRVQFDIKDVSDISLDGLMGEQTEAESKQSEAKNNNVDYYKEEDDYDNDFGVDDNLVLAALEDSEDTDIDWVNEYSELEDIIDN